MLGLYTNVVANCKTMKIILTIVFLGLLSTLTFGQVRTIHVFVALCDNEHQVRK